MHGCLIACKLYTIDSVNTSHMTEDTIMCRQIHQNIHIRSNTHMYIFFFSFAACRAQRWLLCLLLWVSSSSLLSAAAAAASPTAAAGTGQGRGPLWRSHGGLTTSCSCKLAFPPNTSSPLPPPSLPLSLPPLPPLLRTTSFFSQLVLWLWYYLESVHRRIYCHYTCYMLLPYLVDIHLYRMYYSLPCFKAWHSVCTPFCNTYRCSNCF